MRKLFDKLRGELEDFIEQRDDLALLVACSDSDFGLVLQALREIEQSGGPDVFLLFSDAFEQPGPFVSVAVERLREEHRTACEWLAEQGGRGGVTPPLHGGVTPPLLPPLPASLDDATRPPAERLRGAIDFARSLLPQGKGNRLVWAMLPAEVHDWPGYLNLVSALAPWQGIEPWMRGVRLVFRSAPDAEQIVPRLAGAPRLRRTRFQLSQEQIEADLAGQVNDEGLPLEQRMQALLSLAVLDYAFNRPDEAAAKYNHLLGHYQAAGNKAMEAFVLSGLGDVAHRKGDLEQARHWYECAVPPAAEAKDAMALAGVTRNLGDVAYKERRYADAEQFYDCLDKLTAATLDAECKARALEWRGLSQEKQQALDRARGSWETAAEFCRKLWLPQALADNLGHLVRLHRQQHQPDRLAAVEAELKSLTNGEAAP